MHVWHGRFRRLTAPAIALAIPGSVWTVTLSDVRADDTPGLPIKTTLEDFFMPGTQPDPGGAELVPFFSAIFNCSFCHGDFEPSGLLPEAEPFRNWSGSMMAHSARDPMSWAAITVANQDAGSGGDLCIRCHSPAGWLGGRSVPTDGSALAIFSTDFEGVTCHVCHRLVNPVYEAGQSPADDLAILDDLAVQGLLPTQPGNAQYVIDPDDRRRGPYDLGKNFFFHDWRQSPFHKTSQLCADCHDVSNPAYTRQPNGSYLLNAMDTPHPTGDKFDMFPLERTYSEWSNSAYAAAPGVETDGRFGCPPDEQTLDITCRSCQDCHMPDQVSPGCVVGGFPDHDDMPAHFLNGGNTWVINAVATLYSDGDGGPLFDPIYTDDDTGLTPAYVTDSLDRVTQMLRNASDMELTQLGGKLNVRIINACGHKLPTGYTDGRRMWLNVLFLDDNQQVLVEHGHYDFATAELTADDTKVYEARLGLDSAAATKTGLPEGESFHLILNNTVLLDNRIPPIGYTQSAFEAVQAAPVGHTYADGQYWDDTLYAIPADAAEAVVTLWYQTTSKEYIEFLLNENVTDDRGAIAHEQWVLHGKSAPVDMDSAVIALDPGVPGDVDGDGIVNVVDLLIMLGNWGACPAPCPPNCPGDVNADCLVDVQDLLIVLGNWTT